MGSNEREILQRLEELGMILDSLKQLAPALGLLALILEQFSSRDVRHRRLIVFFFFSKKNLLPWMQI
jgi:hypothetical protein